MNRAKLARLFITHSSELKTYLSLIFILTMASTFVFLGLDSLPSRNYGFDIEFNIDHLQQILEGNYPTYFVQTSREVLYYYFSALVAKLVGLSANYFTLRFSSAWIVLGTTTTAYFLIKKLFGLQAAFLGGFFLAISSYHTLLQRLGYRTITLPLILTLVTFFLFKTIKEKRVVYAAILGFFLGLGMYSYTTFIIIPPTIFTFLAIHLLRQKKLSQETSLKLIGVTVFIFVLVIFPLASIVLANPSFYWTRVVQRQEEFIESKQTLGQQVGYFTDNYLRSLAMFHLRGEDFPLYENTKPGEPYLDKISGALLILGFVIFVLHFKQLRYNFFLIIFFLSPVLGSLMSLGFPNEVPAPARMSMSILPVFVMTGVTLDRIISNLIKRTPQKFKSLMKCILGLIVLLLLALSFRENFNRIFVDFPATYQRVIYR